jgi:hypothetical protein
MHSAKAFESYERLEDSAIGISRHDANRERAASLTITTKPLLLHQDFEQRVDDAAWVARYAGLGGRPLKAQAMGKRGK